MKLRLPQALRSALLAVATAALPLATTLATGTLALSAITASQALARTQTSLSTTVTDAYGSTTTYNGLIFTCTTIATSDGTCYLQSSNSHYSVSTCANGEWTNTGDYTGTGNSTISELNGTNKALWTAFSNTPTSGFDYGNTLRLDLSGADSFKIWGRFNANNTAQNAYFGGLITSGSSSYWMYDSTVLTFDGAGDVNMDIGADTRLSYSTTVYINQGGTWNIHSGKTLTLDNNSYATATTATLAAGKTVTVTGGGTLLLGQESNNGNYNLTLVEGTSENKTTLHIANGSSFQSRTVGGTITLNTNTLLQVDGGNFISNGNLSIAAGASLVLGGVGEYTTTLGKVAADLTGLSEQSSPLISWGAERLGDLGITSVSYTGMDTLASGTYTLFEMGTYDRALQIADLYTAGSTPIVTIGNDGAATFAYKTISAGASGNVNLAISEPEDIARTGSRVATAPFTFTNNTVGYGLNITTDGSTNVAKLTFEESGTVGLAIEDSSVGKFVVQKAGDAPVTISLSSLTIGTNSSLTLGGNEGASVSYQTSGGLSLGGSQKLVLDSGSSVNLGGLLSLVSTAKMTVNSGATLTVNALRMSNASGSTDTSLTIDGGTLNITGTINGRSNSPTLLLAHWATDNAKLILNSGEINAAGAVLHLSWAGSGTYEMLTGTASFLGMDFLPQSSSNGKHSTARITGGTLNLGASGITGLCEASVLEFGNATIKATASWSTANASGQTGTITLTATEGGTATTFDTNGYSITINNELTGGGKLVKTGEGTLTLNEAAAAAVTVQEGEAKFKGAVTGSIKVVEGGKATFLGSQACGITATGGTLEVRSGATLDTVTIGGSDTNPVAMSGYGGTITSLTVNSGAKLQESGSITLTNVTNKGTLELNGPVSWSVTSTISGEGNITIRRAVDGTATVTKTGTGNLDFGDGMGEGNTLVLNGGTISGSFGNGTLQVGTSTGGIIAQDQILTLTGGDIDFSNRITDGALTAIALGSGKLILNSGEFKLGDGLDLATLDMGTTFNLFTYTASSQIEATWATNNMMVEGSSVDENGRFFIYNSDGDITRYGVLTAGNTALTLSFAELSNTINKLTWTGGNGIWEIDAAAGWETGTFTADDMVTFAANSTTAGNPTTITLQGNLEPSDIKVLGHYIFQSATGDGSTPGKLVGIGRLTVEDGASLTIQNDNTGWEGEAYVEGAASLKITNANGLGTSSVNLVNDGSSLEFSGIVGDAGAPILITNQITGAGSLTVSGGSNIALRNTTNSYSGGTTITGNSTLAVKNGGSLGNGNIAIDSGSTLAIKAADTESQYTKISLARTITGAGTIRAEYVGTTDTHYSFDLSGDISGWIGTFLHTHANPLAGSESAARTGTVELSGEGNVGASFQVVSSEAYQNKLTVRIGGESGARTLSGTFSKDEHSTLDIETFGASTKTFSQGINADSMTIAGGAATIGGTSVNVSLKDLTVAAGSGLTINAGTNLTINGTFDTAVDIGGTLCDGGTTDGTANGTGYKTIVFSSSDFTKAGSRNLIIRHGASESDRLTCFTDGSLTLSGGILQLITYGADFGTVTMSGGSLSLASRKSSTSYNIASLVLDGHDGSIETCVYNATMFIKSLTLGGHTLTVTDKTSLTASTYTFGNGTVDSSAGSGTVNIEQTNGRVVYVVLNGLNTLAGVALNIAAEANQTRSIAVALDNVKLGGLGSTALTTSNTTYLVSNTAGNTASDTTTRTLTITGTGSTNEFKGTVKGNLNIVMGEQGNTASEGSLQVFTGDLSAFNKNVTVNSGSLTLANTSSTAMGISTLDIKSTAGTTTIAGLTTATTIKMATGTSLNIAAGGTLTHDGFTYSVSQGESQDGVITNGANRTDGALSVWEAKVNVSGLTLTNIADGAKTIQAKLTNVGYVHNSAQAGELTATGNTYSSIGVLQGTAKISESATDSGNLDIAGGGEFHIGTSAALTVNGNITVGTADDVNTEGTLKISNSGSLAMGADSVLTAYFKDAEDHNATVTVIGKDAEHAASIASSKDQAVFVNDAEITVSSAHVTAHASGELTIASKLEDSALSVTAGDVTLSNSNQLTTLSTLGNTIVTAATSADSVTVAGENGKLTVKGDAYVNVGNKVAISAKDGGAMVMFSSIEPRDATPEATVEHATVSETGITAEEGQTGLVKNADVQINTDAFAVSGVTLQDSSLAALQTSCAVTLRDVTMQDSGIDMSAATTNGTVSYSGDNGANGTTAVVTSKSGSVDGDTLTVNQVVQNGGKASGALTVDISSELLAPDNIGKTLTWTIFSGVELADGFSLKLGSVLEQLLNNYQTVTLKFTAAEGGAVQTTELTHADIGSTLVASATNTGALVSGTVGNLVLTVENIPEPTTGTLGMLALAALAARRRRRK